MRSRRPQLVAAALVLLSATSASCAGGRGSTLERPAAIPFELRGDYALIHATINGRPATLILDSGSGAMVLGDGFAAQAGIKVVPFITARAEGQTTSRVQIGIARTVQIGAATLSNVRVAIVPFGNISLKIGSEVVGTLGYELFQNYVVSLDYNSRTMTLTDPAKFSYEGNGVVLPITIFRNLPVVNAVIGTRKHGNVKARLNVDLGSATYAVRLGSGFVDRHGLRDDTVTTRIVFGTGVGGTQIGELFRLPELKLGSLTVKRPSVALSNTRDGAFGQTAETDGTVGSPILRRGRVIFDYARSRAIIEPGESFGSPDSVDASGLALSRAGGRTSPVFVDWVVPGSAADSAGVRPGDQILRVDGREPPGVTAQDVRNGFRQPGLTRELVLLRGADTLTKKIRLRAII
jgi:hypothetical protein